MRPHKPPMSAEQAETRRQSLEEYDSIEAHNNALGHEYTTGQFVLGAIKGGPVTYAAMLAVQRACEIAEGKTVISDRFSALAALAGGVVWGARRVIGRRRDDVKAAEIEKKRAAPTPHSS